MFTQHVSIGVITVLLAAFVVHEVTVYDDSIRNEDGLTRPAVAAVTMVNAESKSTNTILYVTLYMCVQGGIGMCA